MEIIQAANLKKIFFTKENGKKKIVEAVKDVSLQIQKGEIFGFLGPNGAGKTTTQRMLSTLLPIDGGNAVIAGFDVAKQPDKVRNRIGYVGQLGGADLAATGIENLILSAKLYGMKKLEIEKNVKELVGLLDLDDIINRFAKTYSGGQKRRLEIALGLIHKPEVLFLDEPTTGLDPQSRAILWEYIKKLRNGGLTVFLTTHYLEEADTLADRLAIIDHGKIVAQGSPTELKQQIFGDIVKISIKNDNAFDITMLFNGMSFIKEIKAEQNLFYLTVENGEAALPRIFETMRAKEILIETISISRPTLDDVFLKQTGRLLR